MTYFTYFKDFKVSQVVAQPRALEYASNFGSERKALGHNVRRVKLVDEGTVTYRIYFSPTLINPKEAVHA